MRRQRLPQTIRQRRRMIGILAILLGISLIVSAAEHALRPAVKRVAESRADSVITQIINTAVWEQLAEIDPEYQDMVELERDEQGNILAIGTRMTAVNQFQTEISLAVQSAMDTYGAQKLSIPLGTLTGSVLLGGRGPDIPLTVTMTGNMQANISSSFEEAGINQTKHQILLTVVADARAALPWYGVSTRVEVDFIVTETVLVGKVPESYTQVIAGDDSMVDEFLFNGEAPEDSASP